MYDKPIKTLATAAVALIALLAIVALASAVGVAAGDPPRDDGRIEATESDWFHEDSDEEWSEDEYVSDGDYQLAVAVDESFCVWGAGPACAAPGQPVAGGNANPVLFTVLVTWNGEPAPGLDPSVFVFDLGSSPEGADILDFCLPDEDEGCLASGGRFVDHGNGLYSLLANPAPDSGGWAVGTYSVVIALDDCGLVAGALATVTVP